MCNVSVVMALAECAGAVIQVPADRVVEAVVEYTNSEIAILIDEHIHSSRDRQILKRRLIDGICFEPLAEEFNLSTAQIKRIIYKGQEIVFKNL